MFRYGWSLPIPVRSTPAVSAWRHTSLRTEVGQCGFSRNARGLFSIVMACAGQYVTQRGQARQAPWSGIGCSANVYTPQPHCCTQRPHLWQRSASILTRNSGCCLLYTSDAADDLLCVDLGGRRIIKKKKK